MIIKIHDPNDRLFRNFLADIKKAKGFLETELPKNIKQQCAFSDISLKPGSFVEKDLKLHFSDILYSIKIAGTSQKQTVAIAYNMARKKRVKSKENSSFSNIKIIWKIILYEIKRSVFRLIKSSSQIFANNT